MTLKLCMQHWLRKYYHICSNNDAGMTLTYFTAMSNLVPYAFVWEKCKIMDISETIIVYNVKVGRLKLNRWVHGPTWISKVKVIHWPWSKATQIQHFQTSFPEKTLCRLKPNFMWNFNGMEERKFVQMVQVIWPRWPPCLYIIKTWNILLL